MAVFVPDDRFALDFVDILARIGCGHAGAQALDGELHLLVIRVFGSRDARHGLLGAVVDIAGLGVGSDRNDIFVRIGTIGNGQRTLSLIDSVVISIGAFIQLVVEGIRRRPNQGLGTSKGISSTLTIDPTSLSFKRCLAIDELGAVIRLS